MSRRGQPDEDGVTVHVTSRGGFYVNEKALLRSEAAQKMMAKMESILGDGHCGREDAGSSPPGKQIPHRDR